MSVVSLATARAATTGTTLGTVMAAVNGRGQFLSVTTEGAVKTAAKHGVVRHKRTTYVVRTGVEYRNLAQNADRETGALRWGQWATTEDGTSLYPWIIVHTGKDGATRHYLRVCVAAATLKTHVRSTYWVDGVEVSRNGFFGRCEDRTLKGAPHCAHAIAGQECPDTYETARALAEHDAAPTVDVLTMTFDLDKIVAIGSHDTDPLA